MWYILKGASHPSQQSKCVRLSKLNVRTHLVESNFAGALTDEACKGEADSSITPAAELEGKPSKAALLPSLSKKRAKTGKKVVRVRELIKGVCVLFSSNVSSNKVQFR